MFVLVMQFNISFNSGINIFIHVIVLASNYNARNCNLVKRLTSKKVLNRSL